MGGSDILFSGPCLGAVLLYHPHSLPVPFLVQVHCDQEPCEPNCLHAGFTFAHQHFVHRAFICFRLLFGCYVTLTTSTGGEGALATHPAHGSIVPAAMLPRDVTSSWARVSVSCGGDSPSYKVYFTSTTPQRGFVECTLMATRHYVTVVAGVDKATYCAGMWLWARQGYIAGAFGSRQEHIDYEPSVTDVARISPTIQMVEF